MLGEYEALLADTAPDMDPEDGYLSVLNLDDELPTTAFTPCGVKNLKELLGVLKPSRTPSSGDATATTHRHRH